GPARPGLAQPTPDEPWLSAGVMPVASKPAKNGPDRCQPVPAGDSLAGRGKRHCDQLLAWQLASGQSITQAALAAKGGKRTALRRTREPEFRRQVTMMRALILDETRGLLVQSQVAALRKLGQLLASDDPKVALQAAGILAKVSLPGRLVATLGQSDWLFG